jgi:hypothetical protein
MAEWLKAHAWKACIPQGIQGSNPCLSAIIAPKSLNIPYIQQNRQFKVMLLFYAVYAMLLFSLLVKE